MNILFISHDASRSGAPILLRNFINWLNTNTNNTCHLILRAGGILEIDFKNIVNYNIYYPEYYNNYKNITQRLLNRLGWYKYKLKIYHKRLLKQLKQQKFEIIYCNTVVNVDILDFLKPLNLPVLTHVRELESTIEHFGGKTLINRLNYHSQHFIADSHKVKENLIYTHSISENKISVVHEYVEIPDQLPSEIIRKKVKAELNLPSNSFVVGSAGGVLWRKGYDLFIQAAITSCNQPGNENMHFIWVGGFTAAKQYEIEYDIVKAKLKGRVHFIGAKANPLDYFSLFDIFVLPSREEPFGIVGLESALFETPIICFDQAGGMPEFVADNCGSIIPYLNIPELVKALNHYKQNPDIKKQHGINAKTKTIQSHSLNVKAQELLTIMTNITNA